MMWLIDTAGGAHNWGLVSRLYPSADNREVIIETDQYRTILCRCADARATIKKIIEHGQLNDDLDVSTLDGVEAQRDPHEWEDLLALLSEVRTLYEAALEQVAPDRRPPATIDLNGPPCNSRGTTNGGDL